MILTFSPLKQRPEGWKDHQRWSSFTAPYADTLDKLDRELRFLHARYPILQVDAEPGNIRLDGQLRADAKVRTPGVILSFDTKRFGTLSYPCYAFGTSSWKRPVWQANLRAIALGLEALRKVERYGIAERGQQYAGYAELGQGGIALNAGMTKHQASVILAEAAHDGSDGGDLMFDVDQADPESVERAFKAAAKRHHPDTGGDPQVFAKITEARELLQRGEGG